MLHECCNHFLQIHVDFDFLFQSMTDPWKYFRNGICLSSSVVRVNDRYIKRRVATVFEAALIWPKCSLKYANKQQNLRSLVVCSRCLQIPPMYSLLQSKSSGLQHFRLSINYGLFVHICIRTGSSFEQLCPAVWVFMREHERASASKMYMSVGLLWI